MSIPIANFDQTSELATSPHDPMLSLASNCVRDYFGPTVQMVADGLMFRGEPITFTMLVATLRSKCRQKVYSEERKRLLGSKVAARLKHQTLQLPPLRAALLVMVQHNIVRVTVQQTKPTYNPSNPSAATAPIKTIYRYHFDMRRARMLPRYPRYVEYTKKAIDDTTAALVEELLVQGQIRTVDVVRRVVDRLRSQAEAAIEETPANDDSQFADGGAGTTTIKPKTEEGVEAEAPAATPAAATPDTASSNTATSPTPKAVLEALKRLQQNGFLEIVTPMLDEKKDEDEDIGAEYLFDEPDPEEPPKKKVRMDVDDDDARTLPEPEDPAIVALLKTSAFKGILPRHAVWRVNLDMFHDALRAFVLGRLAAERYGHRVQSVGSMVSAALKYLAHKKHAEKTAPAAGDLDEMTFDAGSVMRYLPKPVLALLEKKRKAAAAANKSLSIVSQVAKSLQQLSTYTTPVCVLQVETGAKPEDSKFEICTTRMIKYLQDRTTHQMITDHLGETAARIVTILNLNGHLESDSLAEAAMVPAKDTREMLHRLYRNKYIDLFTLNQSKQHNPSNMIYLWSVVASRLLQNVTDNVAKSLLNLRLRRQHEVEIGKNWIDRAQEAGDTDENENEVDKLNHRKFCLGLERLYQSCLHLDETLMMLEDF